MSCSLSSPDASLVLVLGGKRNLDPAMSDYYSPAGQATLQVTLGYLATLSQMSTPWTSEPRTAIPSPTPAPMPTLTHSRSASSSRPPTPSSTSSDSRDSQRGVSASTNVAGPNVCQPCRDIGIQSCDRALRTDPGRKRACTRCTRNKDACVGLDGLPLRRTKQFNERHGFGRKEVNTPYP